MTSLSQVQTARSFLFVPGDRPERFDKAAAAGADVVILDLEDAVRTEAKDTARQAVREWLDREGHQACVRVNAAGTPDHLQDLESLTGAPGLLAVVLPKAESTQDVLAVGGRLGVPVIALIETAAGVLDAREIASGTGTARLAIGHLDLAVDLGATPDQGPMLLSRSALVLASRAAGLPGPVDGVTTTLDDPEVLAGDLTHAAGLGFTGKLLIHPKQVEGTHEAYRPSEDEVTWAERVLAAVAQTGQGAVSVDGAMVDPPVIARAEDILRRKDR